MAIEKKTVRLLILEDSQNEAERLVSLFRNAGRATRVHRLTSSEDLAEALQQSWDLLIAAPDSEDLSPAEALAAIRRQVRDIPFIQLVPDNDPDLITEALALGAQDALPQGEDERLMLIARRELANLEERRARRAAEIALREAEKRCQLLLDSSVDAIAYVHDGMHIYANRAYLQLFGYESADELEGMPMIDLIASKDQPQFRDFLKNHTNTTSAELQCTGVSEDGRQLRLRIALSPASYDGEPCSQVVMRNDGNSELEEKLREISSQDLVTGLYNRNHFMELLEAATQNAVSTGKASASLAYIRIDRSPQLKAELGLAGFDRLLADLADLLRSHFGEASHLARCGDDVFAALCDDLAPEQARDGLAALLKKVEGHLFEVDGRSAQITLSIGVAGLDEMTPQAQIVIDRAHRCADELDEGNALKLYDPLEELAAAASRGSIVAMLRQALEQDGFRLLFQPIISLRGETAEHYEVLLRLLSPQGEEVAPAEFIEAAAEAGLAETLDRWVILNAIKRLVTHRAKGHNTRLFVHLCAATLQDPTLLPWLGAALKAARLPSDALVLQFNENDATTYLRQTKALVRGLAELHCSSALIHFGGVANGFAALKHLPVDYVKIDGSFLQELDEEENQARLKSLLDNLHTEGKTTIVPDIESASVLAPLWQAGVGYIQGYYLQGPSAEMNYEFPSEEH